MNRRRRTLRRSHRPRHPLGRPGTTVEIARAALFLAAPEAGDVNGAVQTVDGGWTADYRRDFEGAVVGLATDEGNLTTDHRSQGCR